MSQCKCIAAEAARFCTHISTPPKLASSSPQMWRTVSASSSWHDGAAPVSFLRGTQCGIAHQCARASTPVPVNSACHACSRRGGSGASSVGRRGFMGATRAVLGSFEEFEDRRTAAAGLSDARDDGVLGSFEEFEDRHSASRLE